MSSKRNTQRKCGSCGYVRGPNEPLDSCSQCVQRARQHSQVPQTQEHPVALAVGLATMAFYERDDGYHRLTGHLGDALYCKWRFTSGVWEGHYVLWVGDKHHSHLQALEGLLAKLSDVDDGKLRPSRDRSKARD